MGEPEPTQLARYMKTLSAQHAAGNITEAQRIKLAEKAVATALLNPDLVATRSESGTDRLANLIEETRYPWKARKNIVLTAFAAGEAQGTHTERMMHLRKRFELGAKRGEVSPMEAVIGYHILFNPNVEDALDTLARLLFDTERRDRIETHNWMVHDKMIGTQRETFGNLIQSLPYPLFPPHELPELNADVFAALDHTLHGGEPINVSKRRRREFSDIYLLDGNAATPPPTLGNERNLTHVVKYMATQQLDTLQRGMQIVTRALERLTRMSQPQQAAAQKPRQQPQQQPRATTQGGWTGGEGPRDGPASAKAGLYIPTEAADCTNMCMRKPVLSDLKPENEDGLTAPQLKAARLDLVAEKRLAVEAQGKRCMAKEPDLLVEEAEKALATPLGAPVNVLDGVREQDLPEKLDSLRSESSPSRESHDLAGNHRGKQTTPPPVDPRLDYDAHIPADVQTRQCGDRADQGHGVSPSVEVIDDQRELRIGSRWPTGPPAVLHRNGGHQPLQGTRVAGDHAHGGAHGTRGIPDTGTTDHTGAVRGCEEGTEDTIRGSRPTPMHYVGVCGTDERHRHVAEARCGDGNHGAERDGVGVAVPLSREGSGIPRNVQNAENDPFQSGWIRGLGSYATLDAATIP